MALYPSVITSFTYPTASNRLNNPSHSTLENNQSSTIGQVQAVIGLADSASTLGTLIGDLRSPGSQGGGHVQGAAFGGTGQTTFTKGDILIASSPSILTKLAVGTNGYILTAQSSGAVGVSWLPKGIISQNSSIQTFTSIVTEVSIMSVSIPANTLSTNKAIRATIFVSDLGTNGTGSILLQANYGSKAVASVLLIGEVSQGIDDVSSARGQIVYTLLANGTTGAQAGNMFINMVRGDKTNVSGAASIAYWTIPKGSVLVDSTQNQTLGLTARISRNDVVAGLRISGYLVEGIT